jgi:protein-L-isoaspartate O-methyltransferase
MNKVIPSEVLDVLRQSRCEGNQLHLPHQLPRELYIQTAKIIELLGGKWNRSRGTHVFENDCAERVDEAVMAGEVTDFQKLYQFYETPPELARRMVALADVRDGHKVLEPSAGRGAILKAVPQTVHRTAVELNSSLVDLVAHAQRVHYGDFLQCNDELGVFDRIIANPPFRNGQDVDHVRHMYDLLKPGGILVTVMSPAWQYRTDHKHSEFRDWLKQLDHEVEDLPEGTFKASGTNIRTVLVTIRK